MDGTLPPFHSHLFWFWFPGLKTTFLAGNYAASQGTRYYPFLLPLLLRLVFPLAQARPSKTLVEKFFMFASNLIKKKSKEECLSNGCVANSIQKASAFSLA